MILNSSPSPTSSSLKSSKSPSLKSSKSQNPNLRSSHLSLIRPQILLLLAGLLLHLAPHLSAAAQSAHLTLVYFALR